MTDLAENTIFQKVKNGDRSAFRILFQRYFQPLFLFASKFVDQEQAKDIVQDCFYELWQNRRKTEITTSVSAYLFTIVKNRCFKYLKTEQKKRLHQDNFGMLLKQEELLYYTNSEKSILEFGVRDRIEKVIVQLPEKCRQVFEKSRHEGLTNKEIAGVFNISVKAVEKHISKALQLFREEFKDMLLILVALLFNKF
ncbi:RNA polymerase sigma-70 factor [Maribellus comscasis]|uniref:RNA polymerase sigma-70 factor n=1 Tax=Maribellus comscasis TaxID=2681766 RepID=A0A6I6K8K1_9BACT|nr:RNA polymerase sigma-70 factor [Maribellus comscasis]QGY47973.1 RNA polymerase sigma-70 factor [Maribellus comscasis]